MSASGPQRPHDPGRPRPPHGPQRSRDHEHHEHREHHHPHPDAIAAEAVAGVGRRAAILRVALLALLIGAAFAAVSLSGGLSAERVRDWIDGRGAWAPLMFVLVSATLTVCVFPGPLLAGAAGLLFGTAAGFPLALSAATLGAAMAFLIARFVAHDAIERLQGRRLRTLRDWVGRRGFLSVLYARLLPGMPYALVNYAAGLSPVTLRAFAAATALGAAPRAFAYVSLGGTWGDWSSPQSLLAMAIIIAMALVGLWLARDDLPGARRGHGGSGT